MDKPIQYSNHVEHYKMDAEFQDYFDATSFERQNIRRRYEYFFSLIPTQNLNILEIGSGGGFAITEVDKSLCQYFPLDIPVSSLKEIKQKTKSKIFPISGDVFSLPAKDKCFDRIILSEVLEHLQQPLAALKEIMRVLKPGGQLLISVPYEEKITYQICVHCNQPTPTHAHFHSFNEKNLIEICRNAGLNVIGLKKISNKVATRLHFYKVIKNMPFVVWKFSDWFFNLIIPKPSHIIIQAMKQMT